MRSRPRLLGRRPNSKSHKLICWTALRRSAMQKLDIGHCCIILFVLFSVPANHFLFSFCRTRARVFFNRIEFRNRCISCCSLVRSAPNQRSFRCGGRLADLHHKCFPIKKIMFARCPFVSVYAEMSRGERDGGGRATRKSWTKGKLCMSTYKCQLISASTAAALQKKSHKSGAAKIILNLVAGFAIACTRIAALGEQKARARASGRENACVESAIAWSAALTEP